MKTSESRVFRVGGSNGAISNYIKSSWRQAANFDNFEWPYLCNGSFDPLIQSAISYGDFVGTKQQNTLGTERLQEKARTTEEELGRCHQTKPPTDGLDVGRRRGTGE